MNEKPHSVLNLFPKKRKALPKEYQAIYRSHYLKNRDGKTKTTCLSMKMEKWLHKQIAKDVKNKDKDFNTLEIGAGTLNHLPYEPNIITYDIVEPFTELFTHSKYVKRLRNVFQNIADIDFSSRYRRIISIATFEHLVNLPTVVAKAALLLESDGSLRVSIPNEGTILWKLGTKITGAEFKRLYGLDYQVLMNYEHVNTAEEIEKVLQYFFKETATKVFGINKKLSFYLFICCKRPEIEKAADYLTRNSCL